MPAPHSRLAWVDNLRTLLIVLVVNLHACVTYSHVGGWYFKEGIEPAMRIKLPFLLWEAHLQAFFMGLLFLIAGYFAEISAERKSTGTFIKERLWRLGVPVLLYVFVIHPAMVWGINPWGATFPPVGKWYWHYLRSGEFVGSTGPLWFAEALLIFCLVFAIWRVRWGRIEKTSANGSGVRVRTSWALCLMMGLGLASFLVRLVQPIGTSELNLQLCFFPQYLVAFPLGVWLARRRALNDLAQDPLARRIGWLTFFASPLILFSLIRAMTGYSWRGEPPLFGGMNLFAAGLAFWEQFAGVGFSFAAISFACSKMNRETALSRWASDRSFAVYVLHSPILLALTTHFRGLSSDPFLMTAFATLAALVLSFIVADLVRGLPGLNRIF
jgi:glucans biosynthesis protein C